jgi:signal transduction histidine kinase
MIVIGQGEIMTDILNRVKERDATRLAAVIQIGRKINSIRDFDRLLNESVTRIRESFGFASVAIFLLDQNDPEYLYMVACTDTRRFDPTTHCKRIHISKGMVGWVVRNASSRLANDVRYDPYYIHSFDTSAELDLPLRINNSIIGVLNIEQPHIDAFDPEDVPVLELLADQIAIAIQNARLNTLAQEAAATEERNRLARELHDDTIQSLIGIARQLDLLRCDIGEEIRGDCDAPLPENIEKRIGRLQDSLDATMQSLRFLSRELRSQLLKDLGLAAAIEAFVSDVSRHTNMHIVTKIEPEGMEALRSSTQQQIYRIVQEAVGNMLKHSHAKNALFCMQVVDHNLHIELSDDGKGFRVPDDLTQLALTGGMGVINMRQRAREIGGCLEIVSAPGEGTRLSLEVPIVSPLPKVN